MARTIQELYRDGLEESQGIMSVPSGTKVVFTGMQQEDPGEFVATFHVDDPSSAGHNLNIFDGVSLLGIIIEDVSIHIRFDSHEEHEVFQTALLAYQQKRTADAQERTAIAQENTVKVLDKIALRLKDEDSLL